MRPGVYARPGRTAGGQAPGTDPLSLLITTIAVLVGLVAAGLAGWPANLPGTAGPERRGPGPVPARLMPSARGVTGRAALRLLAGAATASERIPYQGVEILDWWGPGSTTAAVADVSHRAGQEPTLRAIAPSLEWPSASRGTSSLAPGARDLPAVPGLSPQLVRLLAANYRLAVTGQGTVAGRPAEVVTVRRPGGGLAATFWLDRATKLPLRRQTYASRGGLRSEEAFLSLSLGRPAGAGRPAQPAGAWRDELTAAQLTSLRTSGWPLPAALPGHLTLLDARRGSGHTGPVVHLAYSDGLSELSVFIQPGSMAPRPAGWAPTVLAGYHVYADDADDSSVAWSAHGFVFTVISQAPARTLSAVVGALPHDPVRRPGVLARMRIGAQRLLTWLGLHR